MSGASVEALRRRVAYGGRKGRSAARRLGRMRQVETLLSLAALPLAILEMFGIPRREAPPATGTVEPYR